MFQTAMRRCWPLCRATAAVAAQGIQRLATRRRRQEQDRQALLDRLAQLQQTCSTKDSHIRELQVANRSLEATAAEATQTLAEVVEMVRQESAVEEGKRLRLADALSRLQHDCNKLRKALQDTEAARREAASKAQKLAGQLQEAKDRVQQLQQELEMAKASYGAPGAASGMSASRHGSSASLQSSGWGSVRGCSSSDDTSSPVLVQPLPHSGSGCPTGCICGNVGCMHIPRQALSMLEDVLDEAPSHMHDIYRESSSNAMHCSTGSPVTAATRGIPVPKLDMVAVYKQGLTDAFTDTHASRHSAASLPCVSQQQ